MSQPKRLLLNPLEALQLTRERIQEVLDDAVARGRMTGDDAAELLAELVRRGRRQADADPAGSFPISGYDDLTAAKVIDRLEGLTVAELRAIRNHERRNANRKSVLTAIERRLP